MRRSIAKCIAIAAALAVTAGLAVAPAGPAAAEGATVLTVCRDAQLRAAIAAVPEGGTILFGCDGTIGINPNRGAIEIHKELTLDANGHSVSISGGHRSQIFFLGLPGTVTMRGLTLKNGNLSGSAFGGGAVFVGDAKFVADRMRFLNNQAGTLESGGDFLSGAGGAISVFGTSAELVVTNSEFVGNSVVCGFTCHPSGGGGAISLRNGGPSLIRTSVFRDNREIGGDGGGAIAATYVSGASAFTLNGAVTIDYTTFENNTSNTAKTAGSELRPVRGGGAVLSLSRPLTIAHSLFKSNTADVDLVFFEGIQASGGAVRSGVVLALDGPRFPTSITDSTFTANVARGSLSQGGAVSVDDQPVWISKSSMNENRADRGAAVSIFGGSTRIIKSRLFDNVNTGDLGEDGAVWTAGRTIFSGTQLVDNTSGCYLAVIGTRVGEVVDKGDNIETPGHSCGFPPVGPLRP
ncbi:MAG: hypothetical protein ACR2HV_03960 [Acidimicrobiales bacterium]